MQIVYPLFFEVAVAEGISDHLTNVQHGTTSGEQASIATIAAHIADDNDPHNTLPIGGVYSRAEVDDAIEAAINAAKLYEIDGGGA
jgi:hypothetical protein